MDVCFLLFKRDTLCQLEIPLVKFIHQPHNDTMAQKDTRYEPGLRPPFIIRSSEKLRQSRSVRPGSAEQLGRRHNRLPYQPQSFRQERERRHFHINDISYNPKSRESGVSYPVALLIRARYTLHLLVPRVPPGLG